MKVVLNTTSLLLPLKPKESAIEAASRPKPIKKKKCPACGKIFPLTKDYYSVDKSKSNGFKSPCKWCHRLKSKEYYNKTAKKVYQKKKITTSMEWNELG